MDVQFTENTLNKTVYTPVFTTPSTPEKLKGYLGHLSRQHVVLAHIMNEISPLQCGPLAEGSDAEDPERKARVDALRKRVREAYIHASGDVADGKWAHLVRLLKMPSIKGRARWIGSTMEAKLAVSSTGWINAESEAEWFEWERRWKEEEYLKRKVESWQQKVDPLSVEPGDDESDSTKVDRTRHSSKGKAKAIGPSKVTANRTDGVDKESALSKPSFNTPVTKTAATLGFPVVKRPNLATAAKPKPSHAVPTNAAPSDSRSFPVVRHNLAERLEPRDVPEAASSPIDEPQRRSIADISEQSFLPPSFQVETSTPKKPDSRRKPSPIPNVPSSSPLSSPPNARIYGRQRETPMQSSSSSQLPSTPTRNPAAKRPRSPIPSEIPEHDYAIKKARTMQSPSSTNHPLPPSSPTPAPAPAAAAAAPKRPGQLPTLTELLASAKKAKLAKLASPTKLKIPRPVNTEIENPLEASERYRVQEEKRKRHLVMPTIQFPATKDTISAKLNTNLYEAASPAKSLSSLAASDSGSDDDEDRMNIDMDLTLGHRFDPPLASTQTQGKGSTKKDRSLGWMGYNSQFDVDGKVDEVSKFMEKDVSVGGDFDFDYDGWMREPSPQDS